MPPLYVHIRTLSAAPICGGDVKGALLLVEKRKFLYLPWVHFEFPQLHHTEEKKSLNPPPPPLQFPFLLNLSARGTDLAQTGSPDPLPTNYRAQWLNTASYWHVKPALWSPSPQILHHPLTLPTHSALAGMSCVASPCRLCNWHTFLLVAFKRPKRM